MTLRAGISGYTRNATAAVVRDASLLAVCEQGRVVRVRDIGIAQGGFPDAALRAALEAAGAEAGAVREYVIAEDPLRTLLPQASLYAHHHAHAAAAFYTSPFDRALVVVCDSQAPEVSIWEGEGSALRRVEVPWRGPGFAAIFSTLTRAAGMRPGADEYRVEALARAGVDPDPPPGLEWLAYRDGCVGASTDLGARFEAHLRDAASSPNGPAAILGAFQRRLGEALVAFLREVAARTNHTRLCLGGGFFFNTCVTTVVEQSKLFQETFVPVNPGNGGLAAGAALARGIEVAGREGHAALVSPFLGPQFGSQEIKAVLDNCKLSYDFLDDNQLVAAAVASLVRGELVAWFRGRLEWGTRALGNRSIFANPRAPYVLENLNRFLKHREAHRAYGLAVCTEDAAPYFEGPARSRYMEYEYRFRDPEMFRPLRPAGVTRARVQTVDADPPMLRDLLKGFGRASGVPVLVNTSFNGLHEPIVCDPRDAVRVFYGTGLDVLVVGNFLLRK